MHIGTRQLWVLALALVGLLTAGAAAQTSIVVKGSARADLSGAVRLAQIATISGPDAEKCGAAEVLPAPKSGAASAVPQELKVEPGDVRKALDAAGVNWGKVTLSAAVCRVTHLHADATTAAQPTSAAPTRPQPQQVETSGLVTIRVLIAERLATLYGVTTSDLRLTFSALGGPSPTADDTGGKGSASILDMIPGPSRRIEVNPGGSKGSARVGVRVDVYVGDRLEVSRSVPVQVLVRRVGCVAAGTIERDALLAEDDLMEEERWVPPSGETPITLEKAVGQAARKRIQPGRLLIATDVWPALSIRRGEEVVVHTLTGGMVLKSRARALASAREGDMVELRRDGSKKTFFARAGTKGIAVLSVGDAASETGTTEAGADREPAPESEPASDADTEEAK